MRASTVALKAVLLLATGLIAPSPASALWSRVAGVPAMDVYSLAQRGDTLLAGVDDAVYASLDGGATWTRSANVGTQPASVEAVWVERGRLWAGTFGRGVWTSADLGASWQDATAGLAGGLFDSHLYVLDFESRGDSLYAGTAGAGTFVKHLRTLGPWSPFGPSLVSTASGSVNDLARAGERLMVAADPNGAVHYNDRGEPDWTTSLLETGGAGVGLQTWSLAWTGSAWLASTTTRIYRSADGTGPWERVGPAVGSRTDSRIVSADGRTFAAFNGFADVAYHFSADGGTTWSYLESVPTVAYDLLLRDTTLYAGRLDGLWRRAVGTLGVGGPAPPGGVEFALAGAHPVRGATAVHFSLPAAGRVRITATDVAGRAVGTLADAEYPAGAHRVAWNAAGLAPGVHFLRLQTPGAERSLRVVLVR